MTFPDAADEREARRQFVRRRQKMVFTIAGSALAIVLVIALVVSLSAVGRFHKQSAGSKPNYGVAVICPPENAKVANHPEVRVRVLNGTNKTGLGSAVLRSLRNRGFNMQGLADFPSKTELARTEIRFGAKGISQGYTVAGHFNDAIMQMDDRQDDLVDVVIGATFNDLVPEKSTLGVGKPIEAVKGCRTDIKELGTLPKFKQ
ncbi:LytR C-terminal domain-containing protein [Bifidobacterium xylocopae]|nr:LytR C-terminal domain-containing protein [Bifidobacterium xylocopae]